MTSQDIQKIIFKEYYERGHCPIAGNITVPYLYEADVLSISGTGLSYEFEIKVSKADFKKDFTKTKKHSSLRTRGLNHQNQNTLYIPSYFFYVCPENLIDVSEIPEYAGLIYCTENGLKEIKNAPRLHTIKVGKDILDKMARSLTEKMIYGCARMTHLNKEIQKHNALTID